MIGRGFKDDEMVVKVEEEIVEEKRRVRERRRTMSVMGENEPKIYEER